MTCPTRRGLTLLEVVAAIALLSALTVAVLPLLVDATKVAAPRPKAVDPTDLRAFADRVIADEAVLARIGKHGAGDETRLPWEAEHERREVVARRVPGADERLAHDWIEFRCGDTRVLRYVPRADTDVASTTGASQ